VLLMDIRVTIDMGGFCCMYIREVKLTVPVHISVDLLSCCCCDEPDETDEDTNDPQG
jgi:hypothetical protein